ncbi:IspA Geranylgeranyl pyrophosphate synthase [Methylophilaceae bacterium]|jgi:farnesyl diphosphate synthase
MTAHASLANQAMQAFPEWVASKQQRIEDLLELCLPPASTAPTKLHSAMRYSALDGGKRIRALLCYAAAELTDCESQIADAAACAVELIHANSLVHDDMPCMDDDDLRRGKPSCHKQFDDATALLVGDALQTLAFEVISDAKLYSNSHLTAYQQMRLVNLLAKATGSNGMAGGQGIDLASVGKTLSQAELETMHQMKTGALIQASILLGAIGANDTQLLAIRDFANAVGLAFQVVDDILDVEADSDTLGKTAGKDADSNKPTYVSILGLGAAKQHAKTLYDQAISALAPLGSKAQRLRELTGIITQRSF